MKRKAERGAVLVDKLPGRFAKNEDGTPKKWPVKEGFTRVNVCSSSRSSERLLSPMILGPISCRDIGIGESECDVALPNLVKNIENLWQYSKVWQGDEDLKTKLPGKRFFVRRAAGWAKEKADRYPLKDPTKVKSKSNPAFKSTTSTVNKSIPLYSWWKGEKLSYLEARRKIYCPIYEKLARTSPVFQALLSRVENGENILILGYDGYDRGNKSWKECFEDTSRPFGHELVLACMLENQHPFPWE